MRFSTWLYTIGTRLAATHAGRRLPEVGPPAIEPADMRPAPVDGPDPLAVAALARGRPRAAAEQRSAVWLRYAEDLAVDEIARVLGKSRVNVRVMLFRAARLAAELARIESGGRTHQHERPREHRPRRPRRRTVAIARCRRGCPRPESLRARVMIAVSQTPRDRTESARAATSARQRAAAAAIALSAGRSGCSSAHRYGGPVRPPRRSPTLCRARPRRYRKPAKRRRSCSPAPSAICGQPARSALSMPSPRRCAPRPRASRPRPRAPRRPCSRACRLFRWTDDERSIRASGDAAARSSRPSSRPAPRRPHRGTGRGRARRGCR